VRWQITGFYGVNNTNDYFHYSLSYGVNNTNHYFHYILNNLQLICKPWCSSDWLIYHLLYLHLFTSVCRGLPSKLHFMQKQCETLYWHIVPYFALFSQMKTFAVIKNNPTKWIPSARCETGIQVSVSQPELHKFHSISQAQATCSGVASQKNWGRQKFWFQASYSILFGIPPLKAQND